MVPLLLPELLELPQHLHLVVQEAVVVVLQLPLLPTVLLVVQVEPVEAVEAAEASA
jgi:hypothetical protein